MPHHVFRKYSLRRILIMQATCSVNVMISRVPAIFCRIDPSLQPAGKCLGFAFDNLDCLVLNQVLRPAGELDYVFTCREFYFFTVRAVNLGVKGKVRRQPLGLRRINMIV